MTSLRQRSICPALVVLFGSLVAAGCGPTGAAQGPPPSTGPGYLFCFWNAENFFDDRNDRRKGPGDREYDAWFAENPQILKLKLAKMTEALLGLNGGKGPDIIALAEVESVRAAELLQEALNAQLPDPSLHYQNVLMKEVNGGRHIGTAIITRLPAVKNRTRLHGKRQRILEGHIVVGGHDLAVFAAHWTSRLQGGEQGRANYADAIYGAVRAMHKSNPAVDVLICGDFNDTPQNESVTGHLHATGNVQAVLQNGDPPPLLDLFADEDPTAGFGTHFYHKWFIFDHLVASPGMLDHAGWSCQPESLQVVNSLYRAGDRQRRPWRFGGERDRGERGYSDHFPVTVRLQVQP